MHLRPVILAVFIALLPGLGLGDEPRLKIHVSVLPQKFFVEQIARDLADVDVLVSPGKSPTTYSPSPDQIRRLARADVYFRIGVPFENGFLHKLASMAPDIQVVDTRKGIKLRDMQAHIHEKEEPGETNDHARLHGPDASPHGDDVSDTGHGIVDGKDPHTWMNPLLVKQQAKTIADTLCELAPRHQDRFQANYRQFAHNLDQLYERLHRLLAPLAGTNLFVFHPAFGYFADAFDLNQIPVETMGRSPKGKELAAIIQLARQEKARVIFVQPQFDAQAARKIAQAVNGAVVSIDPLAYDYLNNLARMGDTISNALTP